MFQGKNIKQHNLNQKLKAQEFLKKNPKTNHVPPQPESQSDTQLNELLNQQIEFHRKDNHNKNNDVRVQGNSWRQSHIQISNNTITFNLPQKKLNKKSSHQHKVQKNKEVKKPKQSKQISIPKSQIVKPQSNLVSVQILKPKGPLVRNYQMGQKQQWENKKVIEDYKLLFVLRKFPKIKNFKNNQKAIIKCSLLGNDVFVCMPTGGGKSLTFQVMTYIDKGVYLCIMPLVSLIFDQEYQANKVGIKAFSLTSGTTANQNKKIIEILQNYESGNESIVIFCTPQKLSRSPQFFRILQNLYQKKYLVKIVIDEVHCVSTWGKEFREEYENLSTLRQNFPKTPILGLTATVTETIKQDIIKRLKIENCYYFQSSFNRPNLYYEVRQKKKNSLNDIIGIIEKYKNKSGIIYCLSKKDCEQMCKTLKEKRYLVAFYHANISEPQKKRIQQKWMNNQLHIIIATIAFGMGINKPDVRFVIHHSLSKSLQNYYQESGRAGRDDEFAECILYYGKSDKIGLQNLTLKNQFSNHENKNFCMSQLSNIVRYCEDKFECRRKFQLNYLGQFDFSKSQCQKTCDNCKKDNKFVQKQSITEAKSLVQFLMSVERLRENISQNQLIQICKNNVDKKMEYKMKNIAQNIALGPLRSKFEKWSKSEIDELITYLLSYQVIQEKIVYVKVYKKGKMGILYLKTNYTVTNKFLREVQTLSFKKKVNEKGKVSTYLSQDVDLDSEEPNQLEPKSFSQYQFKQQAQNQKNIYDSLPEEFFDDF